MSSNPSVLKLKSHGIGISIINWIEQHYRQETESSGGWGGFKLETSFEWGTTNTRICTRAYLVFNIHIAY